MLEKVKKYHRIFWHFRKLHLMRSMEYRANRYFWMLISVCWTLFNLLFFSLLIDIGGEIGGWNKGEMYMLLGVFSLLDAFTWSFFYHNMNRYTMMIYEGGLSGIMLKPVDTQFILMTQSNNFTNLPRFVIGFFTLIYGMKLIRLSPTLSQLALFFLLFMTSFFFIYFLWFSIATTAFWFKRLKNINEIIPSLRRVMQLPRSVYQGVASTIFTVLVPLGLVSSLPTEAFLSERTSFSWSVYFILATVFLALFSRWFFLVSIKKYSGVGT